MTQNANVDYLQFMKRRDKYPVFIAIINTVPTHFSTGTVINPSASTMQIMESPTAGSSQITIDEGKSSIANFSFELLDKNGIVTKLLSQYVFQNQMVTIKMGFRQIPESSYLTIFTGRILNFQLQADNITWRFDTTTFLKDEKQNVFDGLTTITSNIAFNATIIPVVDTGNSQIGTFPKGLKFAPATNGKFYILIDSEVIAYTGITNTSFTGCTRGQLGTNAVDHSSAAQVKNFVVMQDNPLNILLQIILSTGKGTNNPTYDILPEACGLSIDKSLVDVATVELQRNRWISNWTFKFEMQDSIEAKTFFETEIYRFINAYPITNAAGQISVKVYSPPLGTSNLQSLTDDTLDGAPTWTGNLFDRYFANDVSLQFDWNFLTQSFSSQTFFEDATSQAKFGMVASKSYQSKGMRTAVLGSSLIARWGIRYLKRFANPSPIIQAKTFYPGRLIELGDVVLLSSKRLPDTIKGTIAVPNTALMEAIEIAVDHHSGSPMLKLLSTGFSYLKKYAAISPSTKPPTNFPTFPNATPTQRAYAFISRKINNTLGVQGDGSDGYYITP